MRPWPLAAIVSFTLFGATILEVSSPTTPSTQVGGTNVWSLAFPPVYNPQGPGFYYNVTYTNNADSNVTGFVYLVAHNNIGQTVDIVGCRLSLAANATGSCADIVFGLSAGTYNALIFAVALSGIAISNVTPIVFAVRQ